AGTAVSGEAAASTAPGAANAGVELTIEVTVDEDCWTEVTGARGERLHYGLLESGQTVRLAATPPVSLLLGNAEAVRLRVNGTAYPVPRDGRRGNLARFTIYAQEL